MIPLVSTSTLEFTYSMYNVSRKIMRLISYCWKTLRWRHNELDGALSHQPHDCLLNRLLRSRSKKTSKLRVTGLCVVNSPGPVNSPHKRPVTRKMLPFDDVIMSFMNIGGSCFFRERLFKICNGLHQVNSSRPNGAMPLSKPMLACC